MKIATSAYPVEFLATWADYEAKITRWVEEAAGQGAEILLFPEYAAMELAGLEGREVGGDTEASLRAVARHQPAAHALHDRLARRFGVHILAGSGPVWDGRDRPFNRAGLFGPDGPLGVQDKQMMTRFERDPMDMAAAADLRLFDIGKTRVGICICYDSEFPLAARALVEAGAEILLVPSVTMSEAGYYRVRIGSMARALEGQCVVAHSVALGDVPWLYVIEEARGAAGIYGPPDRGFPDDGVIAMGGLNVPGWVYGEASLAAIRDVRADGRVLNMTHWPEQSPRVKASAPRHAIKA